MKHLLIAVAALAYAAPAAAQTASADLARLFADERAFVYREDPRHERRRP